jgi:hypothetical protein
MVKMHVPGQSNPTPAGAPFLFELVGKPGQLPGCHQQNQTPDSQNYPNDQFKVFDHLCRLVAVVSFWRSFHQLSRCSRKKRHRLPLPLAVWNAPGIRPPTVHSRGVRVGIEVNRDSSPKVIVRRPSRGENSGFCFTGEERSIPPLAPFRRTKRRRTFKGEALAKLAPREKKLKRSLTSFSRRSQAIDLSLLFAYQSAPSEELLFVLEKLEFGAHFLRKT